MEKEQIESQSREIAEYFKKYWTSYADHAFDRTFSLRNWATIMATIILYYNIMEIKDTRKSEGFSVSTGNRRFPLDFQDTENQRFSRENKDNIKNNNENNKKNIDKNNNNDYENKLKLIFKNKKILHIGCGYGYFLEVIKSLNAVPFGIEPYCSFPENLNIMKAKAEDLQDDNSELSKIFNGEKFDAIVAHDLFLFSILISKENAHKIIKSLKKYLNKKGIMVFESMNEETLLEKDEIEKLGFKVEVIENVANPYGRICSQIIIRNKI